MGCSSSMVSPEGEINTASYNNNNNNIQEKSPNRNQQNGHIKSQANGRPPVKEPTKAAAPLNRGNKLKNLPPQAPVPKSVAFDVTLDGETGNGLLVARKKPPRLQALEPLDFPKLTSEQLAEKQRLADEKREKMKQRKINTSQKSSKRRKELLKAREFGMRQQLEQEKTEIDDNLKKAELKREQKLQEVKEKQRLREERAKRARERAKQLQNPDDDIEVEKDEEFNGNSDDSWLSNPGADEDMNAEESVIKRPSQMRPTVSASTVDSYDAAFMREERQIRQVQPASQNQGGGNLNDDDFFGS